MKTEPQKDEGCANGKRNLMGWKPQHPRRRAMRPRWWRRPADYIGRSPARLPLVAEKKLYVVVSMDFHACMPDADTIFERFDENAVFKEWRRTKIL